MTRRNDRRIAANGRLLQRPIPSFTRAGLHVRSRCHVNPCDLKRNFVLLAQRVDQLQFPTSFGPQAMVDPMSHDDVSQRAPQERQHMQERRRIWTTRTSDEHHVASSEEFVIPYGSLDETTKRWGMRSTVTAGQICVGQTSLRVQRSSNVLQKMTSDA